MFEQFNAKTVVITGGGGGIAASLIKILSANGANIAALDRNVDTLTATDTLLPLKLDITDQHALAHAISNVIARFGQIDYLFNNAGITHMSKFSNTEAELFDTIMTVNFSASVNITRLCLPYLKQSRGQIIAVSSVAGFAPLYGRSAYSASKHAMEGFFKSLASEVADDGISVLIVCPSFVKSRPELTAQVNTGISSPGAMKKSTNGQQISPEMAALAILDAVSKRQSTLYLGRVARVAHWLYALLPALYMKIMTKGAKQEFE